MSSKNAIGYFSPQRSGCAWYRIEHPMKALATSGVPVYNLPLNVDIQESVIDEIKAFHFYGAVPFSFAPVIQYFKSKGIKIVYDMDDALDLADTSSPHYFSVKKDVWSVGHVLEYVDHITVATPKLEEYVRTRYSFKGPVSVIPNCYFPEEWNHIKPSHEGIRIGFIGASAHVADLITVLPAIKKCLTHENAQFVLMGFGDTSYEQWKHTFLQIAPEEAKKNLLIMDKMLSDIPYEWHPFVDHADFPKKLTDLSLDIGICPLIDTPFNQHRSASKAMEYALAGALPIASNVGQYLNEPITRTNDWVTDLPALIQVIHTPETQAHRMEYVKWIAENRNIYTQTDLLKSIYVG